MTSKLTISLIFLLVAISSSTPLAKPSQEDKNHKKIVGFEPLPNSIFIKQNPENYLFRKTPLSRNDFLYRLARDTARLPMKRGSNSWTINSLGYHSGLSGLFDTKAKRSFGENKRSLFPKLETRSVSGGDYDEFDRDDVMRAAEAELIRRGYNLVLKKMSKKL